MRPGQQSHQRQAGGDRRAHVLQDKDGGFDLFPQGRKESGKTGYVDTGKDGQGGNNRQTDRSVRVS